MGFFSRLFGKKEDASSNLEERFNATLKSMEQFKITAYFPNVEQTGNTFSAKSKIGGFPYLKHENDWPVCPSCSNHMQLFLQLNLQDMPVNKEEGLVQLFYCTNSDPICEVELESFFPFSKGVHCRRVEVAEESVSIQPNLTNVFQEKLIVGWTPKDDYPDSEDHDRLGIDIDEDVLDLMFERNAGIALAGDKLLGWPNWIQGPEYPQDRNTGIRMELLFQFDSEVNLPYMFGDAGIGHLTVSPDNPDEMTFGWACH